MTTSEGTRIAVVGLDGRFPGAANPAEYWDLLMRGGDAIGEMPADRFSRRYVDAEGGPGRMTSSAGGYLTDADAFDHAFFGISPREAAAMDPQQRLLLQCAWRALEDAGVDPRAQAGSRTGVFVGVMSNDWAQLTLRDLEAISPHMGTGNGAGMIANRISYHLDLRGPSWAVDTACSSSLVAVHQAAVALRAGECDQAIAGGVNLVLSPALNLFYSAAGLSAADGVCRPFSRDAKGIVRSEAVAAVVLRRLDDALADGLPIYAVLSGGAVNQDGRSNGLTAPSRWAQQEVLAEAYQRAGIAPAEIRAVEAHGTGTVVGDLIEAKALGAVHGVERDEPCAIGSVKGNIGHAEGAAGITAFIKMVLAVHHGVVPPSRFARTENAALRLADKGLRLLTTPLRLRGRVAVGVSSFGLGGTNAHLVLESAPRAIPSTERPAGGVFTLSADSDASLRDNARQAARELAGLPPRLLGQFCFTSNRVKSSGARRLAVPAVHPEQVGAALSAMAEEGVDMPPVDQLLAMGLLFTGQGSQYPGMTRALYVHCAPYRAALAEADTVLRPLHGGTSVVERMLSLDGDALPPHLAQSALFAVGYAQGAVLAGIGLEPAWLLGHSIGEYAAAVHAGALTLEEGAALVAARGLLMSELPSGAMVAVRCTADEVAQLIADEPDLSVAAVNGPGDVVCSGAPAAVDRLVAALTVRQVQIRRLPVQVGFHSPLVEPILDRFHSEASKVQARAPRRPFASTVHGRVLGPDERLDADYWTEQIRGTVRFADAVAAATTAHPVSHLVELGPKRVLSALSGQLSTAAVAQRLVLCPGPSATGRELWEAVARLHTAGLDPDWAVLYEPEQRVLRRLPPYAFSTESRFWVQTTELAGASAPSVQLTSQRRIEPMKSAGRDSDAFDRQIFGLIGEICGYPAHEIPEHALLHEQLGFDSLMAIQLVERLQRRFGLTTDPQQLLPVLTTPRRLIAYLQREANVDEKVT